MTRQTFIFFILINGRLENEADLRIVIACFNKRIGVFCSIRILMEDILKLSNDLNIYGCHRVYTKVNKILDCIVKKYISIIDSRI